jgi:hypothetical protein
VVIWFLALRFRRRWQAFAIVPAASLAIYLLVPVLRQISAADVGIYLLLGAEAAVVLVVGLFIAVLPRPPAHPHCHYCQYDMRGLHGHRSDQLCPECGMPADGYASVRRQRAKVFAAATNVQPVNGRNLAAEMRSLAAAKSQRPVGTSDRSAGKSEPFA